MLAPSLISKLELELTKEANKQVSIERSATVGGGCINNCYRIFTNNGCFFVKTNAAKRYPGMFEAEVKGLQLLANSNTIKTPQPLLQGIEDRVCFLLMENVESASKTPCFWTTFGAQLAHLHQSTQPLFGLDHNNYIGSLPQANRQHENWEDFFVIERIEPQLSRANLGLCVNRKFNRLFGKLHERFPKEPPALLHGDLWSGNFIVDNKGYPCIIDPAVYYGHREMDIAMTQLFGGFSPELYAAYHSEYPLENGWESRLELANLYPLLVHVNLFGESYLLQIMQILKKFV